MKLFSKIANFAKKAKTNLTNNWYQFCMEHPALVKPLLMTGVSTSMAVNNLMASAAKNGKFQNAISKMVDISSTIIAGVGIVWLVMAVFNWVSAIRQEDSERASKSIMNIFIAVAMILVKVIASVIANAVLDNANTNYGFDADQDF